MIETRLVAISIGAVLLLIGAYWGGYSRASATYKAEIASLRQIAAETVVRQTIEARAIEAKQAEIKSELEGAYGTLVEERMVASLKASRLESELVGALERLRNVGASGGSVRVSEASNDARSCADIREANARLARTVERLSGEGSRLVAEGQRASDVAQIARDAAKAYQE